MLMIIIVYELAGPLYFYAIYMYILCNVNSRF